MPKTEVVVSSEGKSTTRFSWKGITAYGSTVGYIMFLVLPKAQKGPSTGIELFNWGDSNARALQNMYQAEEENTKNNRKDHQ